MTTRSVLESFKPSEIRLFDNFPPLVDTFDKTEVECAAFYIVRTLAVRGDEWRPVRWTEISSVIKESMDKVNDMIPADAMQDVRKFLAEDLFVNDMANNPFARPDFFKLVKAGFARWLEDESDKNRPIELTEQGFERLQRWVRK